MKQKIITLILKLIVIFVPLLIVISKFSSNYNILKFIVLVITGTLLLILLFVNYKTLTIDKKDIIILVFIGIVFISTFLSSNIKKSIFGEENRYEGLLMFAIYICIYLTSKKYFRCEKVINFLNVMFYISMGIGILGIAQNYIDYEPLYPLFSKGMCSTFGNSNFFGSFISIVLPIVISIFILKGNKKGLMLSLVMFFNMIASGTRSAWVAFVIVGLLTLIYLIKQKNKTYLKRTGIIITCFTIICVYLLGGFVPNNSNNFLIKIGQIKKDLVKLKNDGVSGEMGSGRIYIWNLSFKLMIKEPVFGCGPDNIHERTVIKLSR